MLKYNFEIEQVHQVLRQGDYYAGDRLFWLAVHEQGLQEEF